MRLSLPSPGRFKALFIVMLFGAIVIILNSCGRCSGCIADSTGIVFSNFSRTDVDSVVVKQYVAGSNFNTLKDSFKYSLRDNTDSTPFMLNVLTPPDTGDMLVYLPADSLIFKITGITFSATHCKKCPDIALYNLTSYYVNGVKDSAVYNPYGTYGGYCILSK